MSMMTLQDFTMKTLTGETISLSPEEEMEIARKALRSRALIRMERPEHIKTSMIDAIFSTAGTAVGMALAGWILGRVMQKDGRETAALTKQAGKVAQYVKGERR